MAKNKTKAVPKLRFPEFTGEWQTSKAEAYFDSRRETGDDRLPIYSVTLDRGMVRRDSLERQVGKDAGADKNLIARRGDLVYNMMRMWQGAVGSAVEDCAISPAYVVLQPKEQTNAEFFLQMFDRSRALYLLGAYSYGLIKDRSRLYFKDFGQIRFAAPEKDEQDKIAEFLSAIDTKIRQLQQKRELLEQYKRGVMQQILTQKIRFKDKSGKPFPKWETEKLGDFCIFLKGKGISKSELAADGETERVLYGELYSHYGSLIGEVRSRTNIPPSQLILSEPEDVIVPASGESSEDIATCACVERAGVAHGGDLNIIRGDFHGPFLSYYLNGHERLAIARFAQGVSVVHLYPAQLRLLKVTIPASSIEQKRITKFLSSLDSQTQAILREVEQIKRFKTAMLQQLFA